MLRSRLPTPPRPQVVAHHRGTQPVQIGHHDAALHAARNLVGRLPGSEADAGTLLLGSHLDTVRDAGFFYRGGGPVTYSTSGTYGGCTYGGGSTLNINAARDINGITLNNGAGVPVTIRSAAAPTDPGAPVTVPAGVGQPHVRIKALTVGCTG